MSSRTWYHTKRQQFHIDTLDFGSLCLKVETAFLSELDSAEIRERLNRKILSGERLTDEEQMEFIILPMSYKGREAKNAAIRENLDLTEKMPDDSERVFLLSGMLVIANQIIEADSVQRIGRMIRMTKLGQLWDEERRQALAEAAAAKAEAAEAEARAAEAKAEAAEEAAEAKAGVTKAGERASVETERRMAKAMLDSGLSPETVLQCSMYLSKRDILDLAAAI